MTARHRPHTDFDILPEEIKELEEPVDGIAVRAPAARRRDFRLIEPEESRSFRLGELALLNKVADLLNEVCLGE